MDTPVQTLFNNLSLTSDIFYSVVLPYLGYDINLPYKEQYEENNMKLAKDPDIRLHFATYVIRNFIDNELKIKPIIRSVLKTDYFINHLLDTFPAINGEGEDEYEEDVKYKRPKSCVNEYLYNSTFTYYIYYYINKKFNHYFLPGKEAILKHNIGYEYVVSDELTKLERWLEYHIRKWVFSK